MSELLDEGGAPERRCPPVKIPALPGLFVPPEFDFPAIFPAKDNSFGVDDDEPSRNESWVIEFLLRDLALALKRTQIRPPSGRSSGHVIIPGDLYRLNVLTHLSNPDYFIKMTGIMPDPLSC
jgi:hypothetical protein